MQWILKLFKKSYEERRFKELLLLNETIINQFQKLVSDPDNLVVNLNNFRTVIHIYHHLDLDDPLFDQLIEIIANSIKTKKQLYTSKWTLLYRYENNLILPTMRSGANSLDGNLDVLDLSKHQNKKIREIAKSLFTLIDYYLNQDNFYLLFPYELLIFKRDQEHLNVLFGEGYLSASR